MNTKLILTAVTTVLTVLTVLAALPAQAMGAGQNPLPQQATVLATSVAAAATGQRTCRAVPLPAPALIRTVAPVEPEAQPAVPAEDKVAAVS